MRKGMSKYLYENVTLIGRCIRFSTSNYDSNVKTMLLRNVCIKSDNWVDMFVDHIWVKVKNEYEIKGKRIVVNGTVIPYTKKYKYIDIKKDCFDYGVEIDEESIKVLKK